MAYEDILSAARTARRELVNVIERIEEEIDAIKDKEWDGPLSDADHDALAELRARKNEVMVAVEELGYITIGALDKTDEVRRIAKAILGVRRNLERQRQRFTKIAEGTADFSDVLAKLKAIGDEAADRLNST